MSIYSNENIFANIYSYSRLRLSENGMEQHSHDRCELIFIIDGTCQIEFANQSFSLSSRQLIFIDSMVSHNINRVSNSNCTVATLEFECNNIAKGINIKEFAARSKSFKSFLEKKQEYALFLDDKNIIMTMTDLINELELKNTDNDYLRQLLFSCVLEKLSLCRQKKSIPTGIIHITQAKEYIIQHIDQDISVQMIADFVGINRSYLQTLFSRHVGKTIIAYITMIRLDKAAFLLRNSHMRITDIAFSIGFNSRQHFVYTFEKRYNVSPRDFRKMYGSTIQPEIK